MFTPLFMTCSWPIHNLFMTSSQFFTIFPQLVHVLAGPVHDIFFIQFFHILFMTCLGLVHLSTASSWLAQYLLMTFHNLFTTCWWLVDSLFMTCSWFVHWLFTTFSQFFQNLFMACFGLVHYLFTKISHFFTTW